MKQTSDSDSMKLINFQPMLFGSAGPSLDGCTSLSKPRLTPAIYGEGSSSGSRGVGPNEVQCPPFTSLLLPCRAASGVVPSTVPGPRSRVRTSGSSCRAGFSSFDRLRVQDSRPSSGWVECECTVPRSLSVTARTTSSSCRLVTLDWERPRSTLVVEGLSGLLLFLYVS